MKVTLLTLSALTALASFARCAGAQGEPVATRPVYSRPPMDTVVAAEAPAQPLQGSSSFCGRPAPSPRCSGFFLTSLGIEFPLHSTGVTDPTAPRGRHADFPTRLHWTFGLLKSAGRHSFGGAIALTSEETERFLVPNIIEGRYRRWLGGGGMSLDFGVGVKRNAVRHSANGFGPGKGVTAMVGFTPTHWVGITARADLVRAHGTDHRAVMLGAHSGYASEFMLKLVVVHAVRAMLGAIGIEFEEDDSI